MSKGYIEDFGLIKFITSDILIESIILCDRNYQEIENINIPEYYIDEYGKNYFLKYNTNLLLNLDYYLKINNNEYVHLHIGKVTRSIKFDELYQTNITLGAIYSKESTTFRIYTPVSKEVYLLINNNKYLMTYSNNGIYEYTINKDVEGYEYSFLFRINEAFHETIDPYGLSSSINYKKSIVTNLSKIKKKPHHTINKNLYIEEISIRDITSYNMGGTFIDLVYQKEKLLYLKEQGINTIQIMPVFGFGGVDEEKNFDYNWGYNPISWFSFSRYLTSKKLEYFKPIEEFNELVNLLHELDFNIVLDVVFNHVYDNNTFSMASLIPGYCFHYQNGFLSNDSGCGNDLNTKRTMVRKIILDCLKYYVEYFNIDGFRFDLMGLIDIETMNIIKEELTKLNENIILYGEGWNMSSNLKEEEKSIINNQELLKGYKFFNDSFRNILKNHFLLGENISNNDLLNILNGTVDYQYMKDAINSINYIECHDDKTFVDTLKEYKKDIEFDQLVDYISLVISLLTISKGTPFYHLGEEFGRSKKGISNSYNSGDFINRVDFEEIPKYSSVKCMKDIISFKNKYLNNKYYFTKSKENIDNAYLFNIIIDNEEYLLIIKNNNLLTNIILDNKSLIFEKDHLLNKNKIINNLKLTHIGVWILR